MQSNPMEALERDRQDTITEGIANRPSNTTKAYQKPKDEFMAWCTEMNFPDRDTVTELKLNTFIRNKVAGRLSKRQKNTLQLNNQLVIPLWINIFPESRHYGKNRLGGI